MKSTVIGTIASSVTTRGKTEEMMIDPDMVRRAIKILGQRGIPVPEGCTIFGLCEKDPEVCEYVYDEINRQPLVLHTCSKEQSVPEDRPERQPYTYYARQTAKRAARVRAGFNGVH